MSNPSPRSGLLVRCGSAARVVAVVGVTLTFLGPSARAAGVDGSHAIEAGARIIDVSPAVASAVRGLGPGLAFYTSARHPLTSLSTLRRPGVEVASPHLELGHGVLALLRAGGVAIDPGAADLMTLLGVRQLSTTFAASSPIELLLVRETVPERAAIEQAGGVRVLFRDGASGKLLGAPAAGATVPTAAVVARDGAAWTSFGPVVKVERTDKARQRHFDPAQVSVEARTPHPGHRFVTLHITRDFSRGEGTVSFLYGSGIIVAPDYDRLQIEADGKRLRPAAVFDEGVTLELAYEIPAPAKRILLIDGDVHVPLAI